MALSPQLVKAIVFEFLQTATPETILGGHLTVHSLAEGVAGLLVSKGLLVRKSPHVAYAVDNLPQSSRGLLYDYVQQVLWQLLAQGVIVWGQQGDPNSQYPLFRLTDFGRTVVANGRAQPYDPEGFIAEFRRQVPSADPVVLEYLEEGVRAFNASCFRATAVLIGAGSEKAVLVLHDVFGNQISDPAKQKAFAQDSNGISIHRKYQALKARLDLMVSAKRLDFELSQTIGSYLPGAFDMIRNYRNIAGHPDIGGATDPDTVFMSLRIFTEYMRRVVALTDYFKSNPADW